MLREGIKITLKENIVLIFYVYRQGLKGLLVRPD